MNPQSTQVTPIAGGLETSLIGQNPSNANKIINFTIDRLTGGWSTRVGYEKFDPNPTRLFNPFAGLGPISSIHVAQALSGGMRQVVLFESGGTLYLLHDANGLPIIRTLRTGRHIPTVTECSSWYTDVGEGTVITNGVDRPVYVRPWPLGDASESASTITQCIRDFGFAAAPVAPSPRRNTPSPVTGQSSRITGGGATTLWCANQAGAIDYGGKWGFGYSKGPASGDPGNESLFGWAISFISDTGSESPVSLMETTSWQMTATVEGVKHAIAIDIPLGPAGTVARKLYRTKNFSDDWTTPDDTALYFVGLVRNNVDDLYFDPQKVPDFSRPATAIDTGALPSTHPRFSAMFGGCLFLDGGTDDPRSLFYSAPGLIEQFNPINVLTLGGTGGGITAIYNNYSSLLVFRENGIDVVQGSYGSGFQVTTISDSITCRAPKSIATVPGLGVVFLAQDGVYAVTGGLLGGAEVKVISLSIGIDEFIGRVSAGCEPKSVATYSQTLREYLLFAPMDGQDRPSKGLALHVDRAGEQLSQGLSPWSVREGFPVGDISCLYDGTPIFGHHTGFESGETAQQGLFVISAKRALGGSLVMLDDNFAYVVASPPTSTYKSAWMDFGDTQVQKSVQYVTLWIMTTGNSPVLTVKHFKDHQDVPVQERSYKAQPPDALSLPVFDTVLLGSTSYARERLVPVRVSIAQMSCSTFCFEFSTTEDITLIGYEVEVSSKGMKTTAGVLV